MRKLLKHFDFTKTKQLDRTYFNVEVGDKWANSELQHYVDDEKHILFDDGLIMRATLEDRVYKSVRINTKHKLTLHKGKIEVVAKVPKGKGTWPALWLLSQTNPYGHWPRSGEIDIMEHVGRVEDEIFLCLHTESYNHLRKEQLQHKLTIPGATQEFHTYAIDWQNESITYYIDDKKIVTYNKSDKSDQLPSGWPFDHDYYFIMNLAIGGKFGGVVDDSIFPVDFIIKEIKIYE